MRQTFAIAVVVLLVAGCSKSGSDKPAAEEATSTTAAVSTTAAASSPASGLWSQAEAQQKYLAYVKPGNDDIDALTRLNTSNSQDLAAYKAICTKLVQDDDKFQRDLSAGLWPAKAQTRVDALVDALSKDRAIFQDCATATNGGALTAAFADTAAVDAASAAAQSVRIALGLPGTG